MTLESLDRFYQEDYRPIYLGNSRPAEDFFYGQVRHGELIHEFVVSSMPPLLNSIVFDVGCGAGGILKVFSDAGWSGFGCDLGAGYLTRGRAAGLLLEQGGPETLREHAPANLIILSHVLEHWAQPKDSLKRLSQLLVDDGYIYVELPGILNIHRQYGSLRRFLQNAHLYHFTLATLCSLMSGAGFDLVKGDEYICALFQRTRRPTYAPVKNQYGRVRTYLKFVPIYRIPYKLTASIERFMRKARRMTTALVRGYLGDTWVDKMKGRLKQR